MVIISTLMDLPIMTEKIETGYYVGGFIFTKTPMKILGLSVSNREKDKKKWCISLKRVKTCLKEMIIIHHQNDIVQLDQLPIFADAYLAPIPFCDFDIMDYQGGLVGTVKDTVIDEVSGTIKGFIISQGIIDDLTAGYRILPLIPSIQVEKGRMQLGEIDLDTLLLTQRGGLQKLFGIDQEN